MLDESVLLFRSLIILPEKGRCSLDSPHFFVREIPLSSARSNFVEQNAIRISQVCSMIEGKGSLTSNGSICSSGLLVSDRPHRSYNRWLIVLVLVLLTSTIAFAVLYAVSAKKTTTTTPAPTSTTTTPAGTTTTATGPIGETMTFGERVRRSERGTFALYLDDNLCLTPYCIKAGRSRTSSFLPFRSSLLANYLLESMDQTANPCEDFYQFACGTWLETARIPEDCKLHWKTAKESPSPPPFQPASRISSISWTINWI